MTVTPTIAQLTFEKRTEFWFKAFTHCRAVSWSMAAKYLTVVLP